MLVDGGIDYLCVKYDWVNLKFYKKIIYFNLL